MELRKFSLLVATAVALSLASTLEAEDAKAPAESQDMGVGELARQMRERQSKIGQLSPEEQATLQAAHEKAMADPAVRVAMANRDRALQELQITFRKAMVKADPELTSILKRVMIGQRPSPNRTR